MTNEIMSDAIGVLRQGQEKYTIEEKLQFSSQLSWSPGVTTIKGLPYEQNQ